MSAFPDWPQPSFVATNGIRMAVHEAGPAGAAPPLVLCHGFPELAFSWRHQVRDLPKRGWRVLAPDQRGYGLTDAPPNVEDYDIEHLTSDMAGLLDAKGIERAVFVGHDWGGFVAWRMGILHPSRVAGLIGLNTPHMPRAPIDPIELMKKRWGEDMYVVYFQTRDEPEKLFEADLERTFRFFMRRSVWTPQMYDALPDEQRRLALQRSLARFTGGPAEQQLLTDAELAYYVEAYRESGFRGPINWYRNFTRNWERSAGQSDRIEAPSLMIMAENDVVLPPSLADNMDQWVPNLEKHLVKGSGHWTQQEKPDEVTAVIADWMGRTFPR